MSMSNSGRVPLAAGGIAALLASACCLGPLVLITLGISGAWIGNLVALEPYAWRRVFRPPQKCAPAEVCAVPRVRAAYKVAFWVVSVLVLIGLVFPYALPLFY